MAAIMTISLSGCGATQRGSFTAAGYQDSVFDLRVTPASSSGMPMDDQWNLDSHFLKSKEWTPKTGPEWQLEYRFDHDDDGETDSSQKSYAYDLKFVHAVHGGSIFVRTMPYSRKYAQRDLKVLMRSYIDGASRVGYGLVELASGTVAAEVDRYAVNTVVEAAGKVGDSDAWFALIEIASVDDLQLSRDSRRERALLVMIRTPFKWTIGIGRRRGKDAKTEYPVLVIAAYSNAPTDFDRGIADFQGLLERVQISGSQGLSIPEQVRAVLAHEATAQSAVDSGESVVEQAAPGADEPGADKLETDERVAPSDTANEESTDGSSDVE